MRKQSDEKLGEALLHLLDEERGKRKNTSFFPVFALFAAAVAVSFCSFFLYKSEENRGNFAAAKEVIADFFEENETIAVFLGLGEKDEMR